jgi:hypothetical protein
MQIMTVASERFVYVYFTYVFYQHWHAFAVSMNYIWGNEVSQSTQHGNITELCPTDYILFCVRTVTSYNYLNWVLKFPCDEQNVTWDRNCMMRQECHMFGRWFPDCFYNAIHIIVKSTKDVFETTLLQQLWDWAAIWWSWWRWFEVSKAEQS